jgi:hypothetical protein
MGPRRTALVAMLGIALFGAFAASTRAELTQRGDLFVSFSVGSIRRRCRGTRRRRSRCGSGLFAACIAFPEQAAFPRLTCMRPRHPCSATTAPCLPPPRAEARCSFALEMECLRVAAKNSRPYHPQTCGKVERLHQTLKRYLQKRLPRGRSPSCKPNSAPSATTTTPSAPTGPWVGARPCRPTAPG